MVWALSIVTLYAVINRHILSKGHSFFFFHHWHGANDNDTPFSTFGEPLVLYAWSHALTYGGMDPSPSWSSFVDESAISLLTSVSRRRFCLDFSFKYIHLAVACNKLSKMLLMNFYFFTLGKRSSLHPNYLFNFTRTGFKCSLAKSYPTLLNVDGDRTRERSEQQSRTTLITREAG